MSEQAAMAKLNTEVAGKEVLLKLILFSTLLGVFPISSYFVSLNYVWNGNATYAAITAIIAANMVLVGYIIVSVLEDRQNAQPSQKGQEESKKDK